VVGIVEQLHEPLAIFQAVFQAMVLGFTPLFGHNNLPELDLRLAVHVLAWIYERHADEVAFCVETLNVVEVSSHPQPEFTNMDDYNDLPLDTERPILQTGTDLYCGLQMLSSDEMH
jgi:hypothetical protein